MLDKFKNLDKKQKLEFYRVLAWSVSSLGGGIIGARTAGIDFTNYIIGWVIGLVIIYMVFRVLRIIKII
tara:strand:- start:185 stop:391 length:207 start_codon:yes stop_codon:yes gene_type:complete